MLFCEPLENRRQSNLILWELALRLTQGANKITGDTEVNQIRIFSGAVLKAQPTGIAGDMV